MIVLDMSPPSENDASYLKLWSVTSGNHHIQYFHHVQLHRFTAALRRRELIVALLLTVCVSTSRSSSALCMANMQQIYCYVKL